MRKLLLLVSGAYFSLMGSCHNQPDEKQKVVADSANRSDSIAASGIVGQGPGTKKDTLGKPKDSIAIINNSADQAKIDSIKKAKEKNKNPK